MAKRIMKEDLVQYHDLFKAEPTAFRRNVSYKTGIVELESIDHAHFFHTITSDGDMPEYTTESLGHFHKIEVKESKTGEITATCGPAMKKIKVKMPNGDERTKIVPIKYADKMNDRTIIEEHTHEMTYKRSEKLNLYAIKEERNKAAKFYPTPKVPEVPEGISLKESDRE